MFLFQERTVDEPQGRESSSTGGHADYNNKDEDTVPQVVPAVSTSEAKVEPDFVPIDDSPYHPPQQAEEQMTQQRPAEESENIKEMVYYAGSKFDEYCYYSVLLNFIF